jgi:hypothetical protein
MTDSALSILSQQENYLMPAVALDTILRVYQAKKEFIGAVLKEAVDYGPIPGGTKPALLKPGAEKLANFFSLVPIFEDITTIEDWTGVEHGGEPFFYYRQKCKLYKGDQLKGSADGSCNSWEKKYRYRQAERVCPTCGQPTILKSKQKAEWFCWAKKGGCGATFPINDKRITDQELGKIANPDVAEQVNTILKMAQKRALVAAVLITTGASDYFTQDVDDFIEADYQPAEESKKPTPPPPATMPADGPRKPVEANPAVKGNSVQPAPKLTLEEAESIAGSDKKRYGDCTDKELESKRIGINKAMNKPGVTIAQKEEYQRKLDGIKLILDNRRAPVEPAEGLGEEIENTPAEDTERE